MSQGPGRIERGILYLLALSPGHSLSRHQLEGVLVEQKGFSPSNVLRAIRSLQRDHIVSFEDVADKSKASVALVPAEPVADERVFGLLAEIGLGQSQSGGKGTARVRKKPRADRQGE